MHVLGADEAGRGPVIGSMFLAGVMVHEEHLSEWDDLGLKDSKKLSAEQREAFVPRIRERAEKIVVKEVTASEIDELRNVMSLNEIELNAFAFLLNETFPDRAIIDLPEPDGDVFALKLKGKLDDDVEGVEIVAEHEADDTYPIVSAASIIAKHEREKHVKELYEKYGADFRTGYSHDEDTIAFLKRYYKEHRTLPEEVRESWETAKRIRKEFEQERLGSF